MPQVKLLVLGFCLSACCLAALGYGYAPAIFSHTAKPLDVLVIYPKCGERSKFEVGLSFKEPSFLASTAGSRISIQNMADCKSFWISTTRAETTLFLESDEATFKDEKKETIRQITPKSREGNSTIFELDATGLNSHWRLVAENAFDVDRSGFDRYKIAGVLSLDIGSWSLMELRSSTYSIAGDLPLNVKVVSVDKPEDRDIMLFEEATFHRLTELKELFGLLLSTILGIGISSVAQALAGTSSKRQSQAS